MHTLAELVRRASEASMIWLAVVACGCTLLHAGRHVLHGQPGEALWICTLAPFLLGVGLFLQRPLCVGIPVLWLALGLVLWILYLCGGGEFLPTSLLTHVVALGIGLIGLQRLGMPPGAWWRAFFILLGVQQLSRLVTTRQANVNMGARVPDGYETLFPSYAWYWLLMAAVCLASYLLLELLLRRLFPS